jgi:hypothetical protein
MSVKTPPPPPLPDELDRLLRRLRMPYVRSAAPEVIATATAQRWEPAEVLRVLLSEEAAGRDQATIRMRRSASGLPAGKTFDAWEEKASAIPKQTQQALRTLEWIVRAENLCLAGPSGSGKSHFVEALGHQAIDHGKTMDVRRRAPESYSEIPDRNLEDRRVGWAIASPLEHPPGARPSQRPPHVVPVVGADYEGERYVVAMLREGANWVANVRAAGGRAVLPHGGRASVQLDEVEPDARAPILQRYVHIAPGARDHIPVDPRAALEDFMRIASEYPLFHMRARP